MCEYVHMAPGTSAWVRAAALALAVTVMPLAPTSTPAAHAADCPDVEFVFARGTSEPAGLGRVGQALSTQLAASLGDRTLGIYPVNYPASRDYATGIDGVTDAGNHVRDVAANCPATKIVLGGYSQGAGVIALLTSEAITPGSTPLPPLPAPLPPAPLPIPTPPVGGIPYSMARR